MLLVEMGSGCLGFGLRNMHIKEVATLQAGSSVRAVQADKTGVNRRKEKRKKNSLPVNDFLV